MSQREGGDFTSGVDPLADQAPVLAQIRSAGEAAAHPHHGDRLGDFWILLKPFFQQLAFGG